MPSAEVWVASLRNALPQGGRHSSEELFCHAESVCVRLLDDLASTGYSIGDIIQVGSEEPRYLDTLLLFPSGTAEQIPCTLRNSVA